MSLAISLLGPVRVTLDGYVVDNFGVETAQALLAYVVMTPEVVRDREALAAFFWPDRSRADGLRNLRQALQSVRDAIQDRQSISPLLDVTRHTLRVNPLADFWLDVALFESLIEATKGHRHRRLEGCRFCVDRLEQAVRLYRGDFMAGLSHDSILFEEWLIGHQQRLRLQMLALLSQLTLHYQNIGEYEQAYNYARRQTELEPWEEGAHRQVMQSLALRGQRSAALAHYDTFRQTLTKELGVEPTAETTELYSQIRRGDVALSDFDGRQTKAVAVAGAGYSECDTQVSPQHNLPFLATPFVGREEELSRLLEPLLNPSYRLISIVGPGGVGKTRLALAAAEKAVTDHPQGVWFIHLESVGGVDVQQDVVARAVAEVLSVTLTGRQSATTEVVSFLRDKDLLLILDNAECFVDEVVEFVTKLLSQASSVVVLVTSRERLNVQGELVVQLAGLPVPASASEAGADAYASVRLFAERAERTSGRFALSDQGLRSLVQICRALDGYPLGIELAAAWAGRMELDEIACVVERDLDLLVTTMRDVPLRHRSIRAVFEGSWVLLSEDQRTVLAALSVFSGGFDQEAGMAVADTDGTGLRSLVDKSLLYRNSNGRYFWHDLIHQFAVEKLEQSAPEVKSDVWRRYVGHYLGMVSEKANLLQDVGANVVLADLRTELANIEQAWYFAISGESCAVFDRAIDDVMYLYHVMGLFRQGEAMFGEAVSQLRMQMEERDPVLAEDHRRLGRLLIHLAHFLNSQAKHKQARMVAETALAQLEEVGGPSSRAEAYLQLGKSLWARGQLESGQASVERALALARENGLRRIEAGAALGLSEVLVRRSNYVEAEEQAAQALAIYREIGDCRGEAMVLNWLGDAAMWRGDYSQARKYYERSQRVGRQIGDMVNEQEVELNLGMVLAGRGMYEEALFHLEQALYSFRESGQRLGESRALRHMGRVYLQLGAVNLARNCFDPALLISREIKNREEEAAALSGLGGLAQRTGQFDEARAYAEQAVEICYIIDSPDCEKDSLTLLGHALMALKHSEEAEWAFAQAVVLQVEVNPQLPPLEAMTGMAQVAYADGRVEEAMVWVREILVHLKRRPDLPETVEPLWIYWTSYQVLRTMKDSRADKVLSDARILLNDRAARISDERLRQSYLESTSYHRQIVGAGEAPATQL